MMHGAAGDGARKLNGMLSLLEELNCASTRSWRLPHLAPPHSPKMPNNCCCNCSMKLPARIVLRRSSKRRSTLRSDVSFANRVHVDQTERKSRKLGTMTLHVELRTIRTTASTQGAATPHLANGTRPSERATRGVSYVPYAAAIEYCEKVASPYFHHVQTSIEEYLQKERR